MCGSDFKPYVAPVDGDVAAVSSHIQGHEFMRPDLCLSAEDAAAIAAAATEGLVYDDNSGSVSQGCLDHGRSDIMGTRGGARQGNALDLPGAPGHSFHTQAGQSSCHGGGGGHEIDADLALALQLQEEEEFEARKAEELQKQQQQQKQMQQQQQQQSSRQQAPPLPGIQQLKQVQQPQTSSSRQLSQQVS
jgi:hypothetical protein